MNKTTLEGLEEALERLEHIDGVHSWGDLLCEVREALADQNKQEPVAWHEPNAYGNVTTHKKWAEENGWLPLYTKE